MEFLPILEVLYTGPYFRAEQTSYDNNSHKDLKELCENIRESINGNGCPCTAIVANGEIIYNSYDPTRTPLCILTQEVLKEQFAKNPRLLILPYQNLKIVIHMFFIQPWCISITFEDGFYKINSFSH